MLGLSMGLPDRPFDRSQAQQAMDAIRRNGGTLLLPGASTPVLGPELVTNGDFSNGTTGWAAQSGWSISGGAASVNSSVAGATYLRTSGYSALVGVMYIVTFTVTAYTSGSIAATAGTAGSASLATGVGTYTIGVTAAGSGGVGVFATGTNTVATIDNISVREILSYTHGNPPLRNYLDSAGTDILDSVTQVDQPVGLALDSTGVLGPELFTGAYTVGANTTATYDGAEATATFGGALTATAGNWLSIPGAVTANGYSEIEFWATWVSGGDLQYGRTWTHAGSVTSASNAGVRTRYKATVFSTTANASAGSVTFGSATAGSVWKVELISVREIPGNHASQPTTASKPLLRRGLVNQLLWSNDLNQRTTKTNVTISGVSLIPTVTSGTHAVTDVAASVGHVVTYAFRAKPNGYRYVGVSNAGASAYTATFDLVAGVCTVGGSITAADMVLQSDGYYLCRASFTAAYTTVGLYFSNTYTINIGSWVGDGTSGYFIDGVALFQGTVTAAEILASGGIPLTTTAPASSERGRWHWIFDGTDTLGLTLPAGFNAATTIDARSTGHVTLQNQNIVGAYSIGPSITSFGRIILPSSPSASDLALLQRYANWLAGL